jgi:uncharacterized protein YndB with AHSA1/START domain
MKTIHHVLDIAAPSRSVWQALTQEQGLAGWWSTDVSVEGPDAGARIRFTFDGDFNPVMQVIDAAPDARLRWRCVDGHPNWQDNAFTFEMITLDDGRTRLRFTQDYAVELSDDDYGVYNFNWGYYLESLRLLCATGTGKPYRPGQA